MPAFRRSAATNAATTIYCSTFYSLPLCQADAAALLLPFYFCLLSFAFLLFSPAHEPENLACGCRGRCSTAIKASALCLCLFSTAASAVRRSETISAPIASSTRSHGPQWECRTNAPASPPQSPAIDELRMSKSNDMFARRVGATTTFRVFVTCSERMSCAEILARGRFPLHVHLAMRLIRAGRYRGRRFSREPKTRHESNSIFPGGPISPIRIQRP